MNVPIIIAVLIVFFILVFIAVVPVGIWITGVASGVKIGFFFNEVIC